ncbi:MAG TPA: lipopolysaccharide kinase InaA family protein [Anaerohalosphaeraceae bacterium]|jgi:heptose I phosphotransferase|nr:lipopolysaccharide kinase InaA family protein [Anaerohalosphaeraceae bacterium]HRT49130.1 lipopolysaccharide kinase InaA family protein [Anaerohalosphaeraceae bacterium]HRT85617.1 lipopolysaccharide kinase InaA family protein [Anaerohalosphaeraceae bacterium]
MSEHDFVEVGNGFHVDRKFVEPLRRLGLDSLEAVFAFEGGEKLTKANLARHRSRIRFMLPETGKAYYLKRYDRPPPGQQIRNWIDHRQRASTAAYDRRPAEELTAAGIRTARVVAFGEEWSGLFEKRSFVILEEIANGRSLEARLPEYFYNSKPLENVDRKRQFIRALADFARRFHDTGLRHRDFYLCHIFMTGDETLYLIDLQRTFRPMIFDERFRVKDIAQLYYSAPGQIISRADRLRFYCYYVGRDRLTAADRRFLRQVKNRAWRMADHDIRHGRRVPFAE